LGGKRNLINELDDWELFFFEKINRTEFNKKKKTDKIYRKDKKIMVSIL